MPLSGEFRGMSEHRPARNAIVALLGTPDRTEGSLDDPREREEDGVRFNEKWIYTRGRRDARGLLDALRFSRDRRAQQRRRTVASGHRARRGRGETRNASASARSG